MFSDPIVVHGTWTTVTADTGEDWSFPCIERAPDHSTYQIGPDSDGVTWTLFIGHQFGKRNRTTVRLTASGLTPDLVNDQLNSKFSQSVYMVVDTPPSGAVGNATYVAPADIITTMCKIVGGFAVETNAQLPLPINRVIAGET